MERNAQVEKELIHLPFKLFGALLIIIIYYYYFCLFIYLF